MATAQTLSIVAAVVGGFLAGFYTARHSWPEVLGAAAMLAAMFIATQLSTRSDRRA